MMTLHKTNLFWAMIFLVSSLALADIKFYQSGLGRDWEILSAPKNRQGESEAIAQFFETYFPKVSEDREPQGQWKIRKSEIDKTHRHNNYHYYYKGRRVDGLGLGIHYNRDGWIEYADSDLEKNISVEFEGDSPKLRARIAAQLQSQLIKNSGRDLKTLRSWKWEPILWRDEDHPEWLAAFQIEVTFEGPFEIKNLIVEQSSGAILSDYEKIRRVGGSRVTTGVKVYQNSHAHSLSSVSVTSVTTDNSSELKNNLFHVMRDETVSNVTHRTEIVPADYSIATAFETESSLYNPTCVGIDSECANQAFDGVNVFYHLQNYRNRIDGYLNSLVATPQWADPLTVIINSQYVTLGNGKDNAFYFTGDCGYGIDRCLVFLRPSGEPISINNDAATTTSTSVTLTLAASGKSEMYVTNTSECGGGGSWETYSTSRAWPLGQINGTATVYVKYRNSFLTETKCYSDTIIHARTPPRGRVTISGCDGPIYNLAREAIVVVHEYQHYVTDIISGIEFGTNAKPTVGDALHEGYSDYAAASAISHLNSTNVTLLLVSFPACSGLRREIATLKVYEESSDSEDPHLSGLTWASALWKLRTTLGAATVDKIALKSLYFLGANPGFVSSVESLVKADRALNSGANVASIRTLFYTEAKFLGSSESPFKDPNTLETFVGFKGCGGIELHRHREQSQFSGAVFLVWGLLSLFLGRFLSNRRVA